MFGDLTTGQILVVVGVIALIIYGAVSGRGGGNKGGRGAGSGPTPPAA